MTINSNSTTAIVRPLAVVIALCIFVGGAAACESRTGDRAGRFEPTEATEATGVVETATPDTTPSTIAVTQEPPTDQVPATSPETSAAARPASTGRTPSAPQPSAPAPSPAPAPAPSLPGSDRGARPPAIEHSVHGTSSVTGSTYEDFVYHFSAVISFATGTTETVRRDYRISDFPKYSKQIDTWTYRSTTDPSSSFNFEIRYQYLDKDAGIALCRPWVDALWMVTG